MSNTPFFDKFGNEIEATNKNELLEKLSKINIKVPFRTEGRKSDHREKYCICIYLEKLAQNNLLKYPISLKKIKKDPPDFILTQCESETIAIEHRDIGSKKYQAALTELEKAPKDSLLEASFFDEKNESFTKADIEGAIRQPNEPLRGCGVSGYAWENQWAMFLLEGIKEKIVILNRPRFKITTKNDLLLYDNTHVGLLNLQKAIELAQNYLRNDSEILKYRKHFNRISIIHRNKLLFNIFHDKMILIHDK